MHIIIKSAGFQVYETRNVFLRALSNFIQELYNTKETEILEIEDTKIPKLQNFYLLTYVALQPISG
jgi:hypothetical protein